MNKIIFSLIFILGLLSTTAYAANPEIMNNIRGLYDPNAVPTSSNPVLCVEYNTTFNTATQKPNKFTASEKFAKWNYGTRLTPNDISNNAFYWRAEVRDGGCSQSDIYYGWISYSKDASSITYKSGPASHIQLQNLKIAGDKLSGSLGYIPIGPTANTFPVNPGPIWFTGFNLAGLEFSKSPNNSVIPNLSQADEDVNEGKSSDLKSVQAFINQGANTIRLPIRWAYLQPKGYNSTEFNSAYFNSLVMPTLEAIISHKYYAMLDLHSYMHYANVGTQVAGCESNSNCPDGTLIIDPTPYVTIWSNIWKNIQIDLAAKSKIQDVQYLMFDLINEPASSDKTRPTPQQVFNVEVAVIKKLRDEGFPGYILVEGASWTGLHSWGAESGNGNVFTRANFEKAGVDLNKIIINVHQYLDADYSGNGTTCQTNLTTTGVNGFNLDAFVTYLKDNKLKAMVTEFGAGKDQTTCGPALKTFLKYMQDNAYTQDKGYGFVGWTVWGVGHGWGPEGPNAYNLLVTPGDWKDDILRNYFQKN